MKNTPVLHPSFQQHSYVFRRKVFKIFGGAFHVYNGSGELMFYSEQEAFKIREVMRIYADESKSLQLLAIGTPRILDFGAKYDIIDSQNNEFIGSVRRKGLRSILRDEWHILSPDEFEIGTLKEISYAAAMMSRFIKLIPQSYVITAISGGAVASVKRHFNPFILKYGMEITNPDPPIDRRLLIASGILLSVIERREE